MNLGGAFAGGLTRGMEARQAFDERKMNNEHSRNLQNRQMEMREVEFANTQADRAADEAMKKQVAETTGKWYGEHEVDDGERYEDDGMGGVVRIPVKKKVKFTPLMDTNRDIGFMGDMIALSLSSGKYDPEKFRASAESVLKLRETEEGKVIEGALRGDKASIDKFLVSIGESPEGAKLDVDPTKGKFNIILASGRPVNMMPAMLKSKQADAYLKAWETSSKVALNESATNENVAQTTQAIPAAAAASRATADARTAEAEYTRGAKGNLADARADAAAAKGIKIPAKPIDDAIYDSGAKAAVTIYAQRLAANGKTPDVAALEAVSLYQQELSQFMKNPKMVAAAKAKGMTPEQAVARAIGGSK